jgi:hypothetical protein
MMVKRGLSTLEDTCLSLIEEDRGKRVVYALVVGLWELMSKTHERFYASIVLYHCHRMSSVWYTLTSDRFGTNNIR